MEQFLSHLALPEFGASGQKKLQDAHVAIIGMGGLGCPASLYLAASGVGKLTLVDGDVVETKNLSRQILFTPEDLGIAKVEVAAKRLKTFSTDVKTIAEKFCASRSQDILSGVDLVLEGTDHLPTKLLVSDECRKRGLAHVHGGIAGFSGYVVGFSGNHQGERLRDFYAEHLQSHHNHQNGVTCAQLGVVGPLAGVIGTQMSLEVLHLIVGFGSRRSGRVWFYDALSGRSRILHLTPRPVSKMPGVSEHPVTSKTSKKDFALIVDVREARERSLLGFMPGSLHLSLEEILSGKSLPLSSKKILTYCEDGTRARIASEILRERGFAQVLWHQGSWRDLQ